MARGIDLGFVVLELAQLVAPFAVRPEVGRYAGPAILATLAVSTAMNAFAFAAHATGWLIFPAMAIGLAVPAFVYAPTKVGAALIFLPKGQTR